MQGTCNFEKCKFAKEFFTEAKDCFNFKETWWKPIEGEPLLVEDCVPVRTLLMIQELSNRLIGVEQSQEQMRNEAVWVQVVAEVLGKASGVDLEDFVNERRRREHIAYTKDKLQISE